MHLKKGQQQLLYSTFDFPEVAMLQEEQALTTSSCILKLLQVFHVYAAIHNHFM